MELLRIPLPEEIFRLRTGGGNALPADDSPGDPKSGGPPRDGGPPSRSAPPGEGALASLSRLEAVPAPQRREWSLEAIAGRIGEVSGALTPAARLVRQAQEEGEPAAWIVAGPSTFFPPDFLDYGIDLEALPVIHTPGALAGARTAEHLLRSGAFGLVVLDLVAAAGSSLLDLAVQTRLAAMCRKHHAALLCLTRRPQGSARADSRKDLAPSGGVGPFVSLRGEGTVRRTGFDRFTWELQILKDKRQGPGWSHAEVCRGPDGLC